MAFYNRNEVQSILLKLASEKKDYKYIKYEKLGVVSEKSENFQNENLYSCISCKKKTVLSSHLLDLHVSEKHDSFFEVQKAKKPCVSIDNFPIVIF